MSGKTGGADPAGTAYRVHAHAFNTLTTMLAADDRFVPLSVREAIAGAIVEAVEPLIRADAAAGAAAAHERTAELVSEVNELRERIAELERLLAEAVDPTAQDYDNAAEIMRLRDELAKARDACGLLARIVHADVLVMEAAAIEMRHGDNHAAMQWILNARPDQWDGQPGTEWDGRETAQEWFDRQPEVQDRQPGPAVAFAGAEHLAELIGSVDGADEAP